MPKYKMHFNDNQRFLMRSFSIIVLGLFINQLMQTVGSIVVARVLNDPIQFGEVNLLLQVFGMVTLFLNFGFTSSLVYRLKHLLEKVTHKCELITGPKQQAGY